MANTNQARKRVRQAEKRRQHNTRQRSKMRTLIKKVRAAIAAKKKKEAQAAFKVAVSVIDGAAQKCIIKKNTAARYKSRLNTQIKALAK